MTLPPPIIPPHGLGDPALQAVIVSAGRARRAGGFNKSFMEIEGRPIIQHQLGQLHLVFEDRIAVVTDRPEDYARVKVQLTEILPLTSEIARASSLRGLASALLAFPTQWCFVLACDMPWPDMRVVEKELLYIREASKRGGAGSSGVCLQGRKGHRAFHSVLHGSLGRPALEALSHPHVGATISARNWLASRGDIPALGAKELGVSKSAYKRCCANFNKIP
ncbi:NTP transferase domain-containing protein [Candidatus Sumerlaeota bacterium]|nr:NTP transferase domain-containing protein [Candidatus Sumerlaeota bacterium]